MFALIAWAKKKCVRELAENIGTNEVLSPDSSYSEFDLGEIEEEGVGGEVQQVGSRLADADVAQDPQPALIPLLLRLLRAKCAHCPRQQKHLFCHLHILFQ